MGPFSRFLPDDLARWLDDDLSLCYGGLYPFHLSRQLVHGLVYDGVGGSYLLNIIVLLTMCALLRG